MRRHNSPGEPFDEEVAGAEDPDTLDLREIDEMAVQADDPVRVPSDRRRQDHVVRRVGDDREEPRDAGRRAREFLATSKACSS